MHAQRNGAPATPDGARTSQTDDSVALLDRLRTLHDLARLIAQAPPDGWTAEDLVGLACFVSALLRRLLQQAPADVHDGYLDQVAAARRRGL